jgi:hypothetical protein
MRNEGEGNSQKTWPLKIHNSGGPNLIFIFLQTFRALFNETLFSGSLAFIFFPRETTSFDPTLAAMCLNINPIE